MQRNQGMGQHHCFLPVHSLSHGWSVRAPLPLVFLSLYLHGFSILLHISVPSQLHPGLNRSFTNLHRSRLGLPEVSEWGIVEVNSSY